MRLEAEQFPNPVVLIGETISLFFSPVELGGYFYPPFFLLNLFVEPNAMSANISTQRHKRYSINAILVALMLNFTSQAEAAV